MKSGSSASAAKVIATEFITPSSALRPSETLTNLLGHRSSEGHGDFASDLESLEKEKKRVRFSTPIIAESTSALLDKENLPPNLRPSPVPDPSDVKQILCNTQGAIAAALPLPPTNLLQVELETVLIREKVKDPSQIP